MNGVIAALRANRRQIGSSFSVDSIVEFPLDYYLLSEIVEELAFDLVSQHTRARPVAVKLDPGLTQTLLDLALLEAEIPHLCLSTCLSASQTARALDANGAQALYEGTPCRSVSYVINSGIGIACDTARINSNLASLGNPKDHGFTTRYMMAMAERVARSVERSHGQRHLALLPPDNLAETITGLYSTILTGGTYVVPPRAMIGLAHPSRPDFAIMVKMISELRITSLLLNPELLVGLVRVLEASGERLPLLTSVTVVGADVSMPLISSARALDLPLGGRTIGAQLAW